MNEISDRNEVRVCDVGGNKQNSDTVFLMKPESPSPRTQQLANRPPQQSAKSSPQLQRYLHRSILILPTLVSNCLAFRPDFCRLCITHMLHTSKEAAVSREFVFTCMWKTKRKA